MDKLIERYIWAPVLAIIGIIIVGAIMEDSLGIANATILLFISVGGIATFAKFFKTQR
jgi:hypothetical protein